MSVWHELVIEGAENACRAFIVGFTAGRRTARAGVFGHDCGLAPESFGERLRALFAGGSHHVFLAPKELAAPLADALVERGGDAGLRLERRRLVQSIHFAFRVEAFSRPVAAAIRRDLLTDLPAGVRIDALSESEEDVPSAHGTELYSPVHEFIFRASGRYVGRPPGIFEIQRHASGRDFVSIEGMHVDGRTL